MKQYTIYCTPDQTRKAFSLGATLETFGSEWASREMVTVAKSEGQMKELEEMLCSDDHATIIGDLAYRLPTAEQMCGWLEDKHGIMLSVSRWNNGDASIYFHEDRRKSFFRIRRSYKDALLACIDEALDYLIQTGNKQFNDN